MHLMYFNETSYLKGSIGQAQYLSEDQKRQVRTGGVLAIESYELSQGHYKVRLTAEQASKLKTEVTEWFVWQPAVKLVGLALKGKKK